MFKLKKKNEFHSVEITKYISKKKKKKVQPRSKSKMNATYNLINDRLQ